MKLIYQNHFNGLPFDHNTFVAFKVMEERLGSRNLEGFTSIHDVPSITKEDFVIGSLDFVEGALRRLNLKVPEPDYYPKELELILARQTEKTELQYLEDWDYPFFIKPVCHKIFEAKVINSTKDLSYLRNLPKDFSVIRSQVVNFKSEYRIFVSEGKIVGVKHYLGDPFCLPRKDMIEFSIQKYKTSPICYALDIGVTEDGSTLLVEVNDFYSLGYYGLNPQIYTECLLKRWKELVNG